MDVEAEVAQHIGSGNVTGSPLSGFDRAVLIHSSWLAYACMQASCTLIHTQFCGWLDLTAQKHTLRMRCTNSFFPFMAVYDALRVRH
jgi:hypothetical protein